MSRKIKKYSVQFKFQAVVESIRRDNISSCKKILPTPEQAFDVEMKGNIRFSINTSRKTAWQRFSKLV